MAANNTADQPLREAGKSPAPRSFPVLSVLIIVGSLLCCVEPELAAALTFDRSLIEGGEYWRLLTGHLPHWTYDHLLWSLLTFAALAIPLERHQPRLVWWTVALSSLGISLGIWVLQPEMNQYRGLSGLDCGLFGAWIGMVLWEAHRSSDRGLVALGIFLLVCVCAKVSWEFVTHGTVFVKSTGSGFVGVPLAHAIGVFLGCTCAVGAKFSTGNEG